MLAAENLTEESASASHSVYTISPIVEQSSITDKLGIFGSALCLVHCLLLPILLPLFSANSYSPHVSGEESWFHDFIFPALLLVAALAFSKGYRRHHSMKILSLGIGGIILISLGLFSDHIGALQSPSIFTPVGSVILVIAHVLNISKLKKVSPHVHSSNCGCKMHSNVGPTPKLVQLQNHKL